MDWALTHRALAAFALDPVAMGGLWLRGRACPARDLVLAALQAALPLPQRRLHPSISDEALFGGLDLGLTLQAGRAIRRPGILEAPAVLILPMAERAEPGLSARLSQALDASGHALIALDESAEPDEALPPALADRLGLFLDLADARAAEAPDLTLPDLSAARALRPQIPLPADALPGLVAATEAMECREPRALLACLALARSLAALELSPTVTALHIEEAAALTLAHRARRLPQEAEAEPQDPPPPQDQAADDTPAESQDPGLAEMIVAAARTALPPGLLDLLAQSRASRSAKGATGSGNARPGNRRGRPLPARPGRPTTPAALDLLATLRAAAPWQTHRRTQAPGPALILRPGDLRLRRRLEQSDRVLIFAVDASGSSAIARLAEAKGAVELFLAQAYARRDHVALLNFRQAKAELLLPPTRSLAQTKARLNGMPGGGATPLASGLDLALATAVQARRKGMTPTIALLTDGRGNIARDGTPGREAAEADALQSAALIRAAGIPALVLDVANRPQPGLALLAARMGGTYLALPRAQAGTLANTLRLALPEG